MFLNKELNKLESLFPDLERHNARVSQKGGGRHIDHALKSIIAITEALEQSDPAGYAVFFISVFSRKLGLNQAGIKINKILFFK